MNDFSKAAELMKGGQSAQSQFAAAAEELKRRQAGHVGMVLAYDERDPDEVARNAVIGRDLGVSPLLVDAEPEAYDLRLRMQKAAETLRNAPKTAAWLSDMGNGVLAKDDLDNLSWFERGLHGFADLGEATALSRAISRGVQRMKAIRPQISAMSSAGLAADIGRTVDDLYAEELQRIGPAPYAPVQEAIAREAAQARFDMASQFTAEDRDRFVREGAAQLARAAEVMGRVADTAMSPQATTFRDKTLAEAPNTLLGVIGAFAKDPVGGTFFFGETAAEFIPALIASSAATAVTRSPAAGAIFMGGASAMTENTSAAMDFLAEQGVSLATPEEAMAVIQNADLMRAAQERGLTRGVIIGVMDAISGGVAGKTLAKSPIGDVILQGIAQVGFGAGGEALAQVGAGQQVSWRDIVIEGLAELATAPIEVLGVGGRRLLRSSVKAVKAGDTAAALADVDSQAMASKLRARAPDKFMAALEAQGLGDKAVYVPADALKEYFQANDAALDAETMRAWGIDPLTFEEAAQSGNDVAIPMANYATHIAGTDAAAWIAENATSDPEEMSIAEVKAFNASVQDIMQEAYDQAERARLADEELRASDVQIYDQMFSQLRAAGRSPDVAQNEARIWSAFWRTMGERYGEDPLDLARSMGVLVRGPQSPEFRRRDALDIALNTLRTKGERALKPRGMSLAEFVKSKGGIQDTGGDVAAMDPPKGVVAETSKEIRARQSQPTLDAMPASGKGMSLEDMGRMAAEAGYFPDLLGEVNAGTNKGEATDFAARLLEALSEDVAGRKVYAEGEGPDADLQALSDALNERGIDLAAMSNDEIAAALDATGGTKFEQDKRGSIVLPSGGLGNGQTVINLFESADLSTFLHESSHFFLEAFTALSSDENAPQQMKDDLATIRAWVGNDGEPWTVEQHEKFARGGEAYFMEGKAPSLALADAFARFKAWLTRIYRSLAGLNVKITPEIRGVMDRMLATDAEIAEARAEMEMRPLFASAPPGMSKADFATYQRMARRATETAEQALLEKTMAKVRREKEAWYREEKRAVRAEVATEYDRRREYRLIDMLANQLWHGLDENGEARTVPDVQIDRKMLVDQFGDGVLAEISRARLGGKRAIYGDNGSSPEEVAQFFGFASASEMIFVLQNTPKKRDAVAMETERRMTERHGDPLNDGSIEEEALAAIHNEQQANTAVAEARHMARQIGRPVNGMTAKLYRQRARAMIGRMAVRDAIRAEQFLASERKAARAAQDAFAKVASGTKAEAALAEALQAKEQQILNGFLYDEARQIAAEVQRGREKMRSYDKKSVREKLEGGYIEQIDAILADYKFRVRSQRQIARAESLKAFVDRMIEEGREGDLHIDMRLMDEAHRKHYTRLSVDDLRGLFDTIYNIDHLGRSKQKLVDRKRQRDLEESASRVAGQVRKNIGAGKAGEKSRLAAAFNLLWRTDTLLARMDGGQEIGPAYDEIKRSIDEAVSEEQAMHVDMAERLDGLFKEHYSAADLRKMKVARDIPGGNGRAWSKMEILAVALNTGNEDNFARLTANDAAVRNRLTRDQVDALLATLDENDWRFVQGMWDMVNSYWPGLAEVAKRRTGVAPKKVEAKLMVNAPAFVTGGYFPIKYDPELSAAAATDEASGWDKFTATGRGATAAVRNSMTMQRQKTGNGRTLRLDLSVAFAHMRDTIRYIALSEAVDNTYRLVSHPDVVNAFIDAGAKDQHTILRLWLKDVASGPAPSPDALNTTSRILKNNFTLSRLALNFKAVALQITGVGQSAVVIGKRNMIRGYMEYLQNPYGTAQSVVEKSAFMKERQSTFQKDIYDFIDDTQIAGPLSSGYKKAKSVLAKIGFAPIVWAQFWAVDMPTWLGAFRTGIEKYGDEAKAIHFADRMVARAQDSGLMADRAAFERGTLSESVRQSDFVRLFTTLGGYMLTKMNRAYVLSMQTKADFRSADTGAQKVAIALSAATNVALLYLTEAVLVALVFAAMSDDEDGEDVAKFLLRETGSAMVGGMPLIRDAYAGLIGYGGGGIYGSLAEAPANFIRQVAQGENDAALRRSIADMIGMVTGLPTAGPMRAIEGALNDDVPLSEAVFGRNPLGR